jgi:hypothetical protein
MSKTCDWCGEIEPESGSFDSTDEELPTRQTVLCPECSPDSEVQRGIYIMYSFTADVKENTVKDSVENYISGAHGIDNFKLIKDVGPEASMEGHARYAVVIDVKDGLSHYSMRDIMKMEAVIDASNGDPERNNCRARFYNYKMDGLLVEAKGPGVVYDSSEN